MLLLHNKMARRNKKQLEGKIIKAKTVKAKAIAYYNLALFHDNNSRETEAIPNYKKAIALGLPKEIEAQARAWLASSLYKTEKPRQALKELNKSFAMTGNKKLQKFLSGLGLKIGHLKD